MSKSQFEAWWTENEEAVSRLLSSLLAAYGNGMDLDDLKSETFLRCWCSQPGPSGDGYKTWDWTVAKNLMIDRVRQYAKEQAVGEPLIQEPSTAEWDPRVVTERRLIIQSRIDIVEQMYMGWEQASDWYDSRQAKRKVLEALAILIATDKPITHNAIAQSAGLSRRYVSLLLWQIANEILEIESAEMQGLRCTDKVHQNSPGQLATSKRGRIKSHEDMPIS